MRRELLALGLIAFSMPALGRGNTGSRQPPPPQSTEQSEPTGPSRGVEVRTGTDIPIVPGEDVFGTTNPSEVGDPGDLSITHEYDGRAGKAGGNFASVTQKTQVGYTFSDSFWAGLAGFATGTRVQGIPDIGPNRSVIDFDGGSVEGQYVLIQRSHTNPFQLAVDLEIGWNRLDPFSGQRSDTFYASPKIFFDAVVIPDRLYWGLNVSYQPQAQTVGRAVIGSAGVAVSTAVAYEITQAYVIGVEARYFDAFSDARARTFAGDALFIGPTFLWRYDDHVTLNATWSPQIYGSRKNVPGRLDTVDFERQNFRVKFAYTF